MKRNLFNPFVLMGMVLAFAPMKHEVLANSGYGGGSGTMSDPYLISTPEHLNQLQLDVNVNGVDTWGKYYQLTNDIDLLGYDNDSDETNGNWKPIGNNRVLFKGTFDGNGNSISNIEILLPDQNYVGFFGYTDSATIQNLGLENVMIEGNQHVGGVVGTQSSGTISQSYATGNVSGDESVGGLVGYKNSGTISQSYAIGTVTGSYSGGLVGYAYNTSNTTHSYWDVETSGRSRSQGGIGLKTKQMTKRKAKENMVDFDFDSIWQESNSYPLLQWQPEVPITEEEIDLTINGTIKETILSLTIPSNSTTFVLNPNEEVGQQFVASEFDLVNEGQAPLVLELGAFEQTTTVLNDVAPTKYSDWTGLTKQQSKDFALALVPKVGEGWLSLNEGDRWVADLGNTEIGTMKGNSTVSFEFKAKHGSAFSETLAPQYRSIFIFGLQN